MRLGDAMKKLAPEMPTGCLASSVRRRHARRRVWMSSAAAVVVVALGVGTAVLLPRLQGPPVGPADPSEPQSADDPTRYGQVFLLEPADAPARICMTIAMSLPPQCSGPSVVGDIDWEAIDAQEAAGTRWASDVWVTGTFDYDTYTLTLTAPPQLGKPDAAKEPEPPTAGEEATESPFEEAQRALDELAYSDRSPIVSIETWTSRDALVVTIWSKDDAVITRIRDTVSPHMNVDQLQFDYVLDEGR